MIKKIFAGIVTATVLTASVSVFACDCGGTDQVYEYLTNNDGTHEKCSICQNPFCGAPYTVYGDEDCTYEEYEYDQFTGASYQECIFCGHKIIEYL